MKQTSLKQKGKKAPRGKSTFSAADLHNDPDAIAVSRFDFSLKQLLDRYPTGAPDRICAAALGLNEADWLKEKSRVLGKIREQLAGFKPQDDDAEDDEA